jgi:exopolyphosphatase / guanosine-5'-triphosphate,3'-diphosphate pyrophosphatase
MSDRRLLAAVDLGSNSFRLLVGRIESHELGDQVMPIDSLKESVRLAAGLGKDGLLDEASQQRAFTALQRFGERLRSFRPEAVRAVATNTLRVAHNAREVLSQAEKTLGFPIQVIAGQEEARLIYVGAAHALPVDGVNRLVVDIGGGSTECIVGRDYHAALLESANVGCVSLSQQFFKEGQVNAENFAHALYTARAILAPIALKYRQHGWGYAVGTSGTAKALTQAVQSSFATDILTREHLSRFTELLIKAGHVDRVRIEGLKPERRPVLAGGLAALCAVFDELGVDSMRYCNGALRQGVLYDLMGRSAGADMREITVVQLVARYNVDEQHGAVLAETARALFAQLARAPEAEITRRSQLLSWSARLAEIGMTISHEDFHKHSAYILQNSDMPGFARDEQSQMASLALGQTGGLRKLRSVISEPIDWLMVLCLRLASILHRRRDHEEGQLPTLTLKRERVRITVTRDWADAHALSDESLGAEAEAWSELGVFDEVTYLKS